jgi:2-polyprenyl-6-hydroxyphenyl methylase/3-demethylubiquinone-9 3-methyltransferase
VYDKSRQSDKVLKGNMKGDPRISSEEKRFGFGHNWKNFISVLNAEHIIEAKESLKNMLACDDLKGKKFLDIGSGSGLFSLAAKKLGAHVLSFDYDLQSVSCTLELKKRYFPNDKDWELREGSVLDFDFMTELGDFDIVYSWGVLHHTGDMWKALENACIPLKKGGLLFIALYNDQGLWSSFWRKVKKFYCSSQVGKILTILTFIPFFVFAGFVKDMLGFRNPFERYEEYKTKNRGMSVYYDWIDWLGGYPFQVAHPDDVIEFFRKKGLAFLKKKTTKGWGNNEFVFERIY